MIEENAVVAKIENGQVWVESKQGSGCSGCQQKASCSTSALSKLVKKRSVAVDSAFKLNVGDEVVVGIEEGILLRASLMLYLLPLIFMFLGGGLGSWLIPQNFEFRELLIAGSAIGSLLLSLMLINKIQALLLFNPKACPVVVSVVKN